MSGKTNARFAIYTFPNHVCLFSPSDGFLELIHFPLSGDQPNGWNHQYLYFNEQFESHVRHEKVAQHDCFYR